MEQFLLALTAFAARETLNQLIENFIDFLKNGTAHHFDSNVFPGYYCLNCFLLKFTIFFSFGLGNEASED